jgi:hypothetical protein
VDVNVHADARLSARNAERQVRALGTDSLEGGQDVEVARKDAPEFRGRAPRDLADRPRLVGVKRRRPISESIWRSESRAIAAGVGARLKSASAVGIMTSSYVRIEMMQAISCSKTDRCPRSASSNIAASATSATAERIRRSMV